MKGYVSSGLPVPVHVQNIVVRDYCRRHGIEYELSAVENLKGRDMLEQTLASKPSGIVAYSLAQFKAGDDFMWATCDLHFAVEDMRWDRWTPMLLKLKALLG